MCTQWKSVEHEEDGKRLVHSALHLTNDEGETACGCRLPRGELINERLSYGERCGLCQMLTDAPSAGD